LLILAGIRVLDPTDYGAVHQSSAEIICVAAHRVREDFIVPPAQSDAVGATASYE
jgi:hypothetical protein